ncbi:hypothetical protein TNCV_4958811 [Trichonephila clavipes]|uniref:Uncharacterized protein n=1 Tax=Trichonephila clavipes TaxID=2585209 RepID=A0A8X6SHN5_TRICX|nr:hypothetical protein TNCV_4958811 [Trichonephila clavipes]
MGIADYPSEKSVNVLDGTKHLCDADLLPLGGGANNRHIYYPTNIAVNIIIRDRSPVKFNHLSQVLK